MQRITKYAASPSQLNEDKPMSPGGTPMLRQTSKDSTRGVSATTEGLSEGPSTPRGGPARSRGNSYQGKAPPISRTTSTNTITQSRPTVPNSPGKLPGTSERSPIAASPLQQRIMDRGRPHQARRSNLESSSEESDSDASAERPSQSFLSKSQTFRRTPRYGAGKAAKLETDDDDDDDEDDEPAFFTLAKAGSKGAQDLGATLRSPEQESEATREPIPVTRISSQANTESSASSLASSAAPISSPVDTTRSNRAPGPLSPRQRAGIAAVSPRGRGPGGKDGSDGTPSMGSSFSDLDGE